MGAVWLGRDTVLGREVALKRIGMMPGATAPDLAARGAGGAPGRAAQPSPRGGGLRPGDRGRGDLARHGVRRGGHPQRADRARRRPHPRRGRPAGPAGGRRPRRRPRGRDRPPRREALQHDGHAPGGREADRLRDRPGGGRRLAHPDRARHRLPGLPGARGGLRGDRPRGLGRLVARRHALPRPRRPHAVRREREPDGRPLPDRARGAAPARRRRLARARARAHDDPRPGRSAGRWRRCATSSTRAAP